MKTRFFLGLAAVVLLASCSKELQAPETVISDTKTTLEVGIVPATKTVMESNDGTSHNVYWSNGDQIAVNGTASEALENVPAECATTQFTFNGVLSTPYNVLYPASIYADASHVNLPAVQAYRAGGFAEGMFPMAGYSADGSSLSLNHLCAILKIQVKQAATNPDTDNIAAVRFKGRNGEKVSGNFGITYDPAAIAAESGTGAELEVKVVKTLATSTSAAAVYYIVVPAREYANGFDVIVQDVNGHIMTKSKTTAKTLEAGHLYAMTEFEFVPTGTELGVVISNAQELIDFATAYNNKEYADLGSSLVATVTDNITFDATSSAAFNATGGIGLKNGVGSATEDFYFDGLFNGGNYTISGLEATVPLFVATGSAGTVKDLNVDSSCEFTFTHANTSEGMFASVVGYHKGVLNNVKVAADINLDEVAEVTKMTTLGGLAGRTTTGKLQNGCEYSGLISTPAGFTTTGKLIIGGLVGRFSNAGSVSDATFKGAISNFALASSTDKANPNLIIGGVVGYLDGGASVSSSNSTADHEEVATGHSTLKGRIVISTTTAYNSALGGIVGELQDGSVSDCSNAATLSCYIVKIGDASARYIKNGGIVGKVNVNGTVTDCINNGAINHRANPRLQDLGGIAGYNAGSISGCTNNAAVNHMTSGASGATNKGGRIVNIAGIIGENASGASVSDIHNTADIQISAIEDNYDTTNDKPVCEIRMGGVVAYNLEVIDGGASKNITNAGNINLTTTPQNPFLGFELGGVVGYSEKSVKNVVNSGTVSNKLNNAYAVTRLYMGGAVGEMKNGANVEIRGCENSGEVYFNVNAKAAAHTGDYLGGIVGFVTGEDVNTTVSDCENSGYVHINCNITTACTDLIAAGIVGKMNESGSITDCNNIGGASNAGEVYIGFSDAAHTDNYAGGILGKTVDSDLAVSGCTNSGKIWGGNGTKQNGKTFYVGGIAAYLDGASSVDDCENNGVLLNNQFNNTVTKAGSIFEGGIAGFVLGTDSDRISISNVTNNVNSGATITGGRRGYTGGAVGYGEYVDITNATNANSYGGGSGYYIGGIAGWLVNGTISNSTYSGTAIETTQVQGAGGIVCTLDAGSTIDGCSSYLNSITHGSNACVDGDIAGKSVAGSTIKNCHYTGTYGLCSDTNFTDGGSNVADL